MQEALAAYKEDLDWERKRHDDFTTAALAAGKLQPAATRKTASLQLQELLCSCGLLKPRTSISGTAAGGPPNQPMAVEMSKV